MRKILDRWNQSFFKDKKLTFLNLLRRYVWFYENLLLKTIWKHILWMDVFSKVILNGFIHHRFYQTQKNVSFIMFRKSNPNVTKINKFKILVKWCNMKSNNKICQHKHSLVVKQSVLLSEVRSSNSYSTANKRD